MSIFFNPIFALFMEGEGGEGGAGGASASVSCFGCFIFS